MARRRFFVDAVKSGVAELRGEDARHLTRVLRVQPGQQFEVSDGEAAWLAEVAEARGERVVFRVLQPANSPEMPVRVTLCAALIKFDRFEWIVEKATELGIDRIQPVQAARSEKGLFEASQKRLERWRKIAREAGQQSRRMRAPEIVAAARWQPAIGLPVPLRYFLEEDVAPPILSAVPAERRHGDEVALLTGPEGGWTEEERESARAAGWQPVSLGPQIMRAETAALAAISVVTNAWLR